MEFYVVLKGYRETFGNDYTILEYFDLGECSIFSTMEDAIRFLDPHGQHQPEYCANGDYTPNHSGEYVFSLQECWKVGESYIAIRKLG